MKNSLPGWVVTLVLMLASLGIGLLLPSLNTLTFQRVELTPTPPDVVELPQVVTTVTPLPTATLRAATSTPANRTATPAATASPQSLFVAQADDEFESPEPTLTASSTLRPPPTFEPPTITPAPSNTPSITPTITIQVDINIAGIRGAETATPSSTPGCEKRDDWKLEYEVQSNDALVNIAQTFNTSVAAIVQGNCLDDPDLIRVGQRLRVPGESLPVAPLYECVEIKVQTPINSAYDIPGDSQIVFNWIGPRTPNTLIRVVQPDGEIWERSVPLRQNETVDTYLNLKQEGRHEWYVIPLDGSFREVCTPGGPWTFYKLPAPTETPTITPFPEPAAGVP